MASEMMGVWSEPVWKSAKRPRWMSFPLPGEEVAEGVGGFEKPSALL